MEDLFILKNKKVKKLVNIHLLIGLLISILGIILLWVFNTYYISIYLFKSSIIIFRTGLFIAVFSVIYGIFFEKYLNCEQLYKSIPKEYLTYYIIFLNLYDHLCLNHLLIFAIKQKLQMLIFSQHLKFFIFTLQLPQNLIGN